MRLNWFIMSRKSVGEVGYYLDYSRQEQYSFNFLKYNHPSYYMLRKERLLPLKRKIGQPWIVKLILCANWVQQVWSVESIHFFLFSLKVDRHPSLHASIYFIKRRGLRGIFHAAKTHMDKVHFHLPKDATKIQIYL